MKQDLFTLIAEELNLKKSQVKNVIDLLDDGNTVPFIARYRKELTNNLDETVIREIESRIDYLRNLEQRKQEVLSLIAEQDKLTEELEQKITAATILQEVEDLYRPYKQKRQTRATKAKEKGLEPLAELIMAQELNSGDLEKIASTYLDPEKELVTSSDVYQGAMDIMAEWISDDAEIRKEIRKITFTHGQISSNVKDEDLDEEGKYEIYYEFKESVKKIPPHRILALNRGEKEEILQVKVLTSEEEIINSLRKKYFTNSETIFKEYIMLTINDAYKRLIAPSIAREVRSSLTAKAEEHAISIFARNLKSLLLQPPLRGYVVMGIDPAFRTGSKVCIVDSTGILLSTTTIYPHPPQSKVKEGEKVIRELIEKYQVQTIAIGNGTASRETEFFIADILKDLSDNVSYTIVDEAGASVYSASKLAKEEFPDLDVSMRGAVSIARRLQDPLAELVKIEPRSIGVGLYQHDINTNSLETSLQKIVESAVNYVGVDLNTASPSLLKYVAGISTSVAKNIFKYRQENGEFKSREQLKEVYRLGEKTYTQAAGFLRLVSSADPLANTPIHPESYQATEQLLAQLNYAIEDVQDKDKLEELKLVLDELDIKEKAAKLEIGLPTLQDIVQALKQPGRDPRDELPKPIFRKDVLALEDLKAEMTLQGTVRNVVDFGAFVDIGVKEDGLVHISELSYDYVENPLDIVEVGDIVLVKILAVDERRKRISLSMKL